MVTVEEAVSLWEKIDKEISIGEQSDRFRTKLVEHIAACAIHFSLPPQYCLCVIHIFFYLFFFIFFVYLFFSLCILRTHMYTLL